jgi:GNAT superfamily N-acetyltransferase
MIFEPLQQSAQRGELILVDGGLCHWHLRRDGQLTMREIIVLPERQRQGIGRRILEQLKTTPGATSVFAKCPADLPANGWYKAMGFQHQGTETTRSGRRLELWRLPL